MTDIQSPDVFDAKEYKRSRKAYVAQCSFEYAVSLLVADAFLVKLLSSIGVSDTLAGIISSFLSLAFVVQILYKERCMKNDSLTREQVQRIKRTYPEGTRIELDYMDDRWAVPKGTKGRTNHYRPYKRVARWIHRQKRGG